MKLYNNVINLSVKFNLIRSVIFIYISIAMSKFDGQWIRSSNVLDEEIIVLVFLLILLVLTPIWRRALHVHFYYWDKSGDRSGF